MKIKILCLGNEFIKEDSLAKKIGEKLKKETDFEFININHSFELLSYLHGESEDESRLVILDVVEKLDKVRLLSINDIQSSKIITAHDFDAGFFLKLFNKNITIIGIPQKGEIEDIKREVMEIIK